MWVPSREMTSGMVSPSSISAPRGASHPALYRLRPRRGGNSSVGGRPIPGWGAGPPAGSEHGGQAEGGAELGTERGDLRDHAVFDPQHVDGGQPEGGFTGRPDVG